MRTGNNSTIFRRTASLISAVCIFSILLWSLIECSDSKTQNTSIVNVKPKLNVFGFISDSLEHQTYSVHKNETLSDILLNLGVPGNGIMKIVNKSHDFLDIRKINAGNLYHAFTKKDSSSSLTYFVYEKDPVNFVVIEFNDSLDIFEREKSVTIKENQKSAVIDHSLYTALLESESSPELAVKLSQIFAWQIDFYHLQEGDKFKVIYEEMYVDTNLIGIGKIIAAYFYNDGKEFYAIPFVQDSVFQYFDENGNSLKKEFLKAPLEFGRISSRFSKNRFHPVLKTHRPHLGVDYAAPVGTPIRTTGDGIVSETGYSSGNGKYIKIKHNSVYSTMYLHLSRYAKGIKYRTRIKQGQVIGYVGSSGLATGPHLDYRFYVNGQPVDPLKVELPPSHPVKDELKQLFEKQKLLVLERLKKIEIKIAENPI